MKIVTHAQFVPGVCLVCGGSDSDRPWFLDIEKQAEFWGNIYFCNLCCGTMVFLFRAGDVSEYSERILDLESVGQELLERSLRYESALASIISVPVGDSAEFLDTLAHKSPSDPKPAIGVSAESAGVRLTESSDDEGVAELSELDFVTVQPDLTTGW
jgi:hypothetical protein